MKLINIQNREQFDTMLEQLSKATMVVADTEANGLQHYRKNYIISISLYLPEFNTAWNIPFRHGEGQVDVRYTGKNSADVDFHDMLWQGNTKKDIFLSYWFKQIKPTIDFGNLPIEWLQELKERWALKGVTYLFHNARFDLHMLRAEDFPTPDRVLDTMILLHILHEDWRGVKTDKGWGNRRLKWQAKFWELDNAEAGEAELLVAKEAFELRISQFISQTDLGNPMNAKLVYAKFRGMSSIDEYHRNDARNWHYDQVERIAKKLNLHPKANMWMLPSQDVAYYAMLDTILTWQLYEKLLPMIEEWDNVPLFHNICDIQLNVAWVMECNGTQLDVEEAERQIASFEPRLAEIEDVINVWGITRTFAGVESDSVDDLVDVIGDVNIASPKQLTPFLNNMLKTEVDLSLLPKWLDPALVASLENRPMLTPYEDVAFAILWSGEEVNRKIMRDAPKLTSTAKAALEPYKYHPVVALVLEYRKMKKTVTTYLAKWLAARTPEGIVRGNMNPDGTVAGRFSSSGESGNMQNIPDRGGYRVKKAFVPYSDEYILFAIDYGQLEARVAAWIAEIVLPEQGAYSLPDAKGMVELFNEGADMHSYVRDMINVREIVYPNMTDAEILLSVGMPEEAGFAYLNKKVFRQIAKTLNFGLLYSGTKYMVSTLLKIELDVAQVLVEQWRGLFPAFQLAQDYYHNLGLTWRETPQGNKRGMYVTQPITGRHRKAHKYATYMKFQKDGVWQSFNPRDASAKKFWNNVVQGLSGWMSVDAALRYQNDHTWEGMKLFAQIHDALDGQIKKDELYRVKLLMDYMVDYPTNPVLTVDLEAGYNWQPASVDNPSGMRDVHDIDLWISSNGELGYD